MRFFEQVHGVYFDDLDAFQILHNARYLLVVERTIGAFWAQMGHGSLLDAQSNPDQFHLVRANQIDYLRAVRGVGQVRVRIWVEKLGRTSLVFGFRLLPLDEDVDYAKGSRVLVRVDPVSTQAVPWTDAFRARIQSYRHDLDRAPGAEDLRP
jgi:acyl-CoA thioester hydrolase